MRAWTCRSYTDDFSGLNLEQVELRTPHSGEVRVRLHAASLNFPDMLIAQGKYQLKPDLPFTPGIEASGEVIALGEDVSSLSVGDKVLMGMRVGAFAEEANVLVSSARRIPVGMSYAEAAAYPAAYLTAYVALVCRGNLQRGEFLLVHGAAGGVGLAAVDIGRLLGANIIAAAATEEKRQFLKSRGADHVIGYDGGFRDDVKAITKGKGADVIYDPIGGDVFDESARCIAWNGRLLGIGFAGGRIPEIGANIPLIKGFSVVGVRAGEYGRRDPVAGARNIETIDAWAAERKIQPHVHKEVPLEDLKDAYRLMQARQIIGKLILTM